MTSIVIRRRRGLTTIGSVELLEQGIERALYAWAETEIAVDTDKVEYGVTAYVQRA